MTRRGLLLFAAMCVLWGIPYLFIRIAVSELTPASLVFVRTGIAALILMPFVLARGGLREIGSRWVALIALAAVEIAGPWFYLSSGEQRISIAIAFLLFFRLIAEIGPVRATVITYVNHAVAAILGVAVLHENLTLGMGFGFALVLAGSVLATRRRAPSAVSRRAPRSPAREGPV